MLQGCEKLSGNRTDSMIRACDSICGMLGCIADFYKGAFSGLCKPSYSRKGVYDMGVL